MREKKEASIGSVKVVYASKRSYRRVVVGSVAKYKVIQLVAGNAVYLKRLNRSRCNSIACMSASELGDSDGQVL